MIIKILTPESVVFEGEVDSVLVPGINGDFHIMKNHAAIVSALKAGKVKIFANSVDKTYAGNLEATKQGEFAYAIKSGVIEFNKDKGIVLCEG
ncbi:F0F1 ATP synthase subunit epsilon [Elizabethkingia sp. JS20170427COW]|uniref:FoF1 ATP synthase subunit delta/epsilon n=1 Tax=Elizabethkingia sp. JS20170427COW TaxID=2583851 RepID=UPI001110E1D7|nr:F0F1 ATP synthase subunit epsilon [Elizabethkingia sp. JS20170427COW]QCX52578.1 F0F1 ATP synthase subunit epsilon [Elizabethkingia sp. JS20170427COW]